MTPSIAPRLGAACGALFAVTLLVAAGDGSTSYSPARALAGLVALTLFLPFLAALHARLRDAESSNGSLASTALAGGLVGITLKLASGAPETALHRAHITDGTALHTFGSALADATTVVALYPLAILCAATAVLAWRTHALPRWIAAISAITAAGLVLNGAFLQTASVPALLLFIAWTLATSIHMLRRTQPHAPKMPRAQAVAHT
jgi:uncharacterized membrane protein YhaH (DUF805 family)